MLRHGNTGVKEETDGVSRIFSSLGLTPRDEKLSAQVGSSSKYDRLLEKVSLHDILCENHREKIRIPWDEKIITN